MMIDLVKNTTFLVKRNFIAGLKRRVQKKGREMLGSVSDPLL